MNEDRELKLAIAAAYAAIQAARDLIDQQLNSPGAMRDALKVVETSVEVVETEGFLYKALADELIPVIIRVRKQRDEAVRQRNYLFRNRGVWDDSAAWNRVISSLKMAGYPELAAQIEKVMKND